MSNGGIHQYAVAAQFHRHRSIRGRADTGINEYGHFGVVDDQAQIPGIDNAHARADQRGQRHDCDAADLFEHLCLDRVVGAIHHHLKTFFDQRLRRLQRFRHIRKQSLRVAQHFQFAQRVPIEQFARQTQRAHRLFGRITACGIGQNGKLRRRKRIEQIGFIRILSDIHAPDGNGHDLRTGGIDRCARFGKILVFSGTDQQARTVSFTGNRQGMRVCIHGMNERLGGGQSLAGHQPPPTATTISSLSPSSSNVSA